MCQDQRIQRKFPRGRGNLSHPSRRARTVSGSARSVREMHLSRPSPAHGAAGAASLRAFLNLTSSERHRRLADFHAAPGLRGLACCGALASDLDCLTHGTGLGLSASLHRLTLLSSPISNLICVPLRSSDERYLCRRRSVIYVEERVCY